MTGINYYIKFFSDGVASQWLNGYGIRYDRTTDRGFGIWRDGIWSAIETKKGRIFVVPKINIGVYWVFHFSITRIPTNPEWNGW